MISRTKLKQRIRRKTNPSVVETISLAMRAPGWKVIANILGGPTRRYSSANLFEIDDKTSEGDTIVIPGKILSKGELTKRIVICALSASEKAKEKIKESKSKFVYLFEEIKNNPKAEGIKILTQQDLHLRKQIESKSCVLKNPRTFKVLGGGFLT